MATRQSDPQLARLHQQKRLLLLRHAAKCQYTDGQCPVTPHCGMMKSLWRHIGDAPGCTDMFCKVPHCVSSRYVLSHYHRCTNTTCDICIPVKTAIARSNAKRDTHLAQEKKNVAYKQKMETKIKNSGINNTLNLSSREEKKEMSSMCCLPDEQLKKRSKTTSSSDGTDYINSLPHEALSLIAGYLPNEISAAMFVVALTAPSSSWERLNWKWQPSMLSKSIMQPYKKKKFASEIDFACIGKDVANKLTDGDLGAILVCIESQSQTPNKKLKLTGLVNITGSGLSPIKGFTALWQIDLSLVGQHESARIEPAPLLSDVVVVPILQSIMDNGSSSFKHLQLPQMWRDNPSECLDQFLIGYNNHLKKQPFCCQSNTPRPIPNRPIHKCLETNGEDMVTITKGDMYGLQNFTCYVCYAKYCGLWLPCTGCSKYYCGGCIPIKKECSNCLAVYCKGCTSISECTKCGTSLTEREG